ncbi:CbiM family transporter [Candidatus Contubernalis alkaliaceticus]|uniref:CbiM family transporter n=1 Tax=Candidatus Contubernalis alkaliaceticus TaxID=338645 RepID=UPI001F4C3124|nr:CbiM family transporter [Candidatus Contubernalis alkalaceticus]UNC93111.1 cobalt transporter CbiM [Candidatus Contubernalis alkalaceticus]
MHLADGVLSLPVAAAAFAGAGVLVAYSLKGVQEEEIPMISLMTGGFFALSLISIPVGPSTIHPVLGGLLGIILGRRAPLAFFVGLLLQAILFQHGGLSTLGANTLMLALPALVVHKMFQSIQKRSVFLGGALSGGVAIAGTLVLLISFLLLSDQRFADGFFSVVNLLIAGHLPLILVEGLITGYAVKFLYNSRPSMLKIPGVSVTNNSSI